MQTNIIVCLFFFSFSFFKYLQILSWPGVKVATALTASTHQREQWSQFKSKLMPGWRSLLSFTVNISSTQGRPQQRICFILLQKL